MAKLSDANRREAWRDFQRKLSTERDPLNVTKADLRAALDALDDWVDSNQIAMNQAIPQPARANLTTAQKARLLQFVVRKRYIEGA